MLYEQILSTYAFLSFLVRGLGPAVALLGLFIAAPAGAQAAGAQTADAQTAGAQTADAQTADAQTADAQIVAAPVESGPTIVVVEEAPPPAYDPGDPAARVIVGLLTGLSLITAGVTIGYLVGEAAASPCVSDEIFCSSEELGPIWGAMIGAGVGVALTPLSVALSAHAVGGRGHFGWTYLGGLIGTVVGGGIAGAGMAIADTLQPSDRPFMFVPAAVLGGLVAIAAPIIAYEMSDHSARTSEPSGPELTWMPTFSIDRYGATAGIAGTF